MDQFNAWREQSQTIAQIAAYGGSDCALTGRGLPERVRRGTATASLFAMLGVGTADPTNLGAASLVLVVVGMVACWIPARRATQVDPMVAIRSE